MKGTLAAQIFFSQGGWVARDGLHSYLTSTTIDRNIIIQLNGIQPCPSLPSLSLSKLQNNKTTENLNYDISLISPRAKSDVSSHNIVRNVQTQTAHSSSCLRQCQAAISYFLLPKGIVQSMLIIGAEKVYLSG